jgi:hypothetical protein
LNQWEIYQKNSYLLKNHKMQVLPVDTNDILDHIDFQAPAQLVFKSKQIIEEIDKGIKGLIG